MSQTKFVFRVCVEIEYTAQEIKDEFDSFSEMTIEDIEKQLTWLNNEEGIIIVEEDGRCVKGCQDTVNDFIEESLEVEEAKDWEEVYSIDPPLSLIYHFKGPCSYFQTSGGGPEGGYVLFDSDVYSVTRHWFEDWSSTKLVGKKLEYAMPDEYFGKKAEVRVF